MPALLSDPTAAPIYRTSGAGPFPIPNSVLPASIRPLHVTLRDGTTATLVPFSSPTQAPPGLVARLNEMLNAEIAGGDTYPMTAPMERAAFGAYWFANFAAVLVQGALDLAMGCEGVWGQLAAVERLEGGGGGAVAVWERRCLGTYYVKPNYPGRSSHVCNAGFLVAGEARGKGVGRGMAESYLVYAPKLGYKYSIFNLVYETNTPSLKIWDALGFQRVGRVKGAGDLRSYPGRLVDAIVYGRDLVDVSESSDVGDVQSTVAKWYGA